MKNMRKQNPSRFRKARADATVGSLEKQIEETFGLPPGSVALRKPGGRKCRSDSEIGSFRRSWGE